MKPEVRFCSVNLRAVLAKDKDDADLFTLEGVAASYDTLSDDLGGFRERIAPGAFARAMREGHDVVCNMNHDRNHILGRTKSGTLNIFDVAKGLGFRCQLDPNNTAHRNIHSMVKRGDLDECSFSFSLPEKGGDEWDEAIDENGRKFVRRTLKDVNLHDVSVVRHPAYPQGTAASARATSDAAVDAYYRHRAAEIGQEIERDFQRRIEAATRAVAEDRRRGEI